MIYRSLESRMKIVAETNRAFESAVSLVADRRSQSRGRTLKPRIGVRHLPVGKRGLQEYRS